MKKLKWLALVFVSAIMITGCGKERTPEEVVDDASKKMNELSNYAMKLEMTMSINSSGIEMTIPITIDEKVDEDSKIASMNMTFEMFGVKMTSEGYIDMSQDQTVTYAKDFLEDTWTKEYSANNELDDFVSITENASKVEKKDSEVKNVEHYQVTIEKDKMQQLLNASMNTIDETEEYTVNGDVVVDLYIDSKTNYINKMEMDLSNSVSMNAEDVEITAFSLTITLSDFNTVGTITIPDDVVANAVESSETVNS